MDHDVLVKVEAVRKKFCRSLKRSLWYGMKDMAAELSGRGDAHEQLRRDEFWAVADVSFELRRGECLGLIGHNGAGKTTLLKMLNGLIKPDRGRIEIRGRTGALIALGAGFDPILTGRENTYVNASVLGLSKRQVDAKMDEILDFAEIGEFIDSPVQNFSSGMNVRLGFAVAAILIEPDVLFLDEVLAVGDIGFTIKCLNAVRRLAEKSAVIFVSHNMQFVSAFCSRVILMEKGKTLLDGPPSEGIDRYYKMVELETQQSGTGQAEVIALAMCDANGEMPLEDEPRIQHGKAISVILEFKVYVPDVSASLQVYIVDESMVPIMCFPICDRQGGMFTAGVGRHCIKVALGSLELSAGKYSFVVAIADKNTEVSLARVQGLLPFRVFDEKAHWGRIVRQVLATPQPMIT